jgi:methyl-accepting chemotaxis protein
MLDESGKLTKAAIEGRLATRGDVKKLKGGYASVIQGFNDTLDAVIGPLNVAADYVDRISKGAMPVKISDSYNGDFNAIKENLNKCIDAINGLVADANMLSSAAMSGNFSARADVSRHNGDYAKVVMGVNQTLDIVVDKTFWYEQILDSIPFPLSVTDMNMNWTFINKPVEDMLKVKRKDILGKQCSNWGAAICKTKNCGIECLRNKQCAWLIHLKLI